MPKIRQIPETATFHYFNANPKNRICADCVYRAVSEAAGVSYVNVVTDAALIHLDTGYIPTDKRGTELLLKRYGFGKYKQPRKADNTKYTGAELCRALTACVDDIGLDSLRYISGIVINIGGHHATCIKWHDGQFKVFDIWDSSSGSVGNMYMDDLTAAQLKTVLKKIGSI